MTGGWTPEYGDNGGMDGIDWVAVICIVVAVAMIIAAVWVSNAGAQEPSGATQIVPTEVIGTITMRVVKVDKGGAYAQPYASPVFELRTETGFAPKEKDVLTCQVIKHRSVFGDHADNDIAFVCIGADEGSGALQKTLVLKGLDF